MPWCPTMLLGLVTSVVNLKRQEIHLNSARRSTVPDTEKGTPCAKAPSVVRSKYETRHKHCNSQGKGPALQPISRHT